MSFDVAKEYTKNFGTKILTDYQIKYIGNSNKNI